MHNLRVPLQLRDILASPAITRTDEIGVKATRNLIADAVKRLHKSAVNSAFDQDTARLYPSFPSIERLDPSVTKFWQFEGITADEGTIEGTYRVHNDIYLRQLQLTAAAQPEQPDDFTHRLYLVHGDQLTTQRIRAIQQEQVRATCAYDHWQWLCGIPSWFHIKMNLLHTIIRTYWALALPNQSTVHCVSSDATRWNRSQQSWDNVKYHLMEPIVTQGVHVPYSRVVLCCSGVLPFAYDSIAR